MNRIIWFFIFYNSNLFTWVFKINLTNTHYDFKNSINTLSIQKNKINRNLLTDKLQDFQKSNFTIWNHRTPMNRSHLSNPFRKHLISSHISLKKNNFKEFVHKPNTIIPIQNKRTFLPQIYSPIWRQNEKS